MKRFFFFQISFERIIQIVLISCLVVGPYNSVRSNKLDVSEECTLIKYFLTVKYIRLKAVNVLAVENCKYNFFKKH